jgi:hypothetical protein
MSSSRLRKGHRPVGDTMTFTTYPAFVVFPHTEKWVGIRSSTCSAAEVVPLCITVFSVEEVYVDTWLSNTALFHDVDPLDMESVKDGINFFGVDNDVITSIVNSFSSSEEVVEGVSYFPSFEGFGQESKDLGHSAIREKVGEAGDVAEEGDMLLS